MKLADSDFLNLYGLKFIPLEFMDSIFKTFTDEEGINIS